MGGWHCSGSGFTRDHYQEKTWGTEDGGPIRPAWGSLSGRLGGCKRGDVAVLHVRRDQAVECRRGGVVAG